MQSIESRRDLSGIPHTYIVLDNGTGIEPISFFEPPLRAIFGEQGVNGRTSGAQPGQVTESNRITVSTTYIQASVGTRQYRTIGGLDFVANNLDCQLPNQFFDKAGNPMAIFIQANPLLQMNGSGIVRSMRTAANNNAWQIVA